MRACQNNSDKSAYAESRSLLGISIDLVSPVIPTSGNPLANRCSEVNHLPEQHSLLGAKKQIPFRDVVYDAMEVWRSTDPNIVGRTAWTMLKAC